MKKIVRSPVDLQNGPQFSELNKILAGATHVETYTREELGCGEDRTLVLFAFYPDGVKEVEASIFVCGHNCFRSDCSCRQFHNEKVPAVMKVPMHDGCDCHKRSLL